MILNLFDGEKKKTLPTDPLNTLVARFFFLKKGLSLITKRK